jgi:HD domain
MSSADRRHAVVVTRRVDITLGPAATRPVLAAALLHDVGKIDSGFGPVGRAAATVAGMVGGRDAARRWRARDGLVGRVGRYLCHDEIGAELLAGAGSDALTIAWAREHHLPSERWTVAAEVGAVLKAADDD